MSEFNSTAGMKGHLIMRTIDKATGAVIDEFNDRNVITIEGFSEVMKRLTYDTNDVEIAETFIHNIVLGNDFGSGTIFEPEAANNALTSTSQSVVYEIPAGDIVTTYINSQIVEYGTVLDGTNILNTFFPTDVDMPYTSATLRFKNGKTFSYKRFNVRSLSRLVDIQIVWRVSLVEETN